MSAPAARHRVHLWVFLPILGLVPTSVALVRATADADRAVIRAALRWQAIGASILLMHLVLQLGVVGVDWFAHSMGTIPPVLEPLFLPILWLISLANVGSGIVEYCFVAFWGLRAAGGAPLPFSNDSRG